MISCDSNPSSSSIGRTFFSGSSSRSASSNQKRRPSLWTSIYLVAADAMRG